VTDPPTRVVVVGGGITGLAAAYELNTRGISFALLEASSRLGGLIRTERANGYTIDSGADSILAQKPAALALCEELGLAGRLMTSTPPRTAYVHARGKLHPLPSPSVFGIPTTDRGLASYELLPEPARAEIERLASQDAPTASTSDESVADFFRRQFGPDTVSLIAEPLLGGIHAGDVERLSIESVAPRLAHAAAESGSALRAFRRSNVAPDTEGMFRALRDGMGELVSAIAERLPRDAIHLDSPASHITRQADSFRIVSPHGSLEARAVIVAAPAHAAAGMLADLDPAIASRCGEVPYVSTASIALAWPRSQVKHPLEGSGFVVAHRHSSLRITACTWVSSKWEDRAPRDMVLVRAFLGGAHDPEAATLPDALLIEVAVRDVSEVLGIPAAPQLTRVQRWIRAGAQHNVGHRDRLAQIDRRLEELPGLFVAGGGFHAIGVPDCIADGRASAAAAADYVKIQK
jgi:protoporphyrinogen/coproporphyrinogen III oxidase